MFRTAVALGPISCWITNVLFSKSLVALHLFMEVGRICISIRKKYGQRGKSNCVITDTHSAYTHVDQHILVIMQQVDIPQVDIPCRVVGEQTGIRSTHA